MPRGSATGEREGSAPGAGCGGRADGDRLGTQATGEQGDLPDRGGTSGTAVYPGRECTISGQRDSGAISADGGTVWTALPLRKDDEMVPGRVTMHARTRGAVAEVEPKLRQALAAEGLGIITEVDLEAKIAERLGEQVGPYRLLGACAPDLAHRAISAWKGFGVFLPCTIALYEAGGDTVMEAANPLELPGVANNPLLANVARVAHERLERALRAVGDGSSTTAMPTAEAVTGSELVIDGGYTAR